MEGKAEVKAAVTDNKELSDWHVFDKDIMYLAPGLRCVEADSIPIKDFYLLKVTDVCYDEQAPKKEALENVLSSLQMEGIFFIFLIVGKQDKVDFYYGVSRDLSYQKEPAFEIQDIGDSILNPAIQGNFRGSRVEPLSNEAKRDILETLAGMTKAGVIEGVPGANKDDEKYQGIDRLVNVMYRDSYCFLVVAKPLNSEAVRLIEDRLYHFYDLNAPWGKRNVQIGSGSSSGKSDSVTEGSSESDGTSGTVGKSTSESHSDTEGNSESNSHTKGTSQGTTEGSSSNSKNHGGSESDTTQSGTSQSHQDGTSSTKSESNTLSHSKGISHSSTQGQNSGVTQSQSATVEYCNHKIQDFIKFMDEVVFPRLDYGKGKGIFLTSMCVLAQKRTSLLKLKNTVTALYSGESGNKIPLHSFDLSDKAVRAFKNLQLPRGNCGVRAEEDNLAHFPMHHYLSPQGEARLGNWITTNELGMIAGLPQKEVVGLSLNEEVEFGLNFKKPEKKEQRIGLGCLIQNGKELEHSPVFLDKEDLDKHIFVAGVTGSGKTTTCQTILEAADMPFLVIEPAKTEYREMLRRHPDLLVFTLGDSQTTPLRMNPFVFYQYESLTSRVDMLCACIESAFDMEAAIPQIIEKAIYESYRDKGWNVNTNQNSKFDNPFDGSGEAFPCIEEVIAKCEEVVNKQGFDDRLRNDYIGSIKARLMGLTSGGKGFLLNSRTSVDFCDLLEHKVVFELDNIRSSAEKSLIMGFILINLAEAIREKYRQVGTFRHITLVEEAHRLLSRHLPGDNPVKKQSVEMFSDMLAEIRKYGESLIIVEQIPNKLTPDVLKNTNTKIIHRIFAADDKEAVGNTVMLKNEQKEFLSNLPTGRAVYFSAGTEKAVQIQIKPQIDTSGRSLSDEEIRSSVSGYYRHNYRLGLFMGLECFECVPSAEQFNCLRALNSVLANRWNLELRRGAGCLPEETRQEIRKTADLLGSDCLAKYLQNYQFPELYKYVLRLLDVQ